MAINNIMAIRHLANQIKLKKGSEQEYEELKKYIQKSNIFKGQKKKLYKIINQIKNRK